MSNPRTGPAGAGRPTVLDADPTEELTTGLAPQERADVFGGTAARAYRLPEAGS